MKVIVITIVLLLVAAAGFFAWRVTLPVETWTYEVMDRRKHLCSGDLEPWGDPAARRDLLRAAVLGALPEDLSSAAEDFQGPNILTLRVQCSINRRRWRWDWPPLDSDFPIQSLQQPHLYYRSGPSPGWQAYYHSPLGQEPLPRDQAIERLLDLIEDHYRVWQKTVATWGEGKTQFEQEK